MDLLADLRSFGHTWLAGVVIRRVNFCSGHNSDGHLPKAVSTNNGVLKVLEDVHQSTAGLPAFSTTTVLNRCLCQYSV